MKRIPIRVLRDFAKKYSYTHIIMFATDERLVQYVATYGKSITDCDEAARAGDTLKDALGWPEILHATPSRVRTLQKRVKELETDLETRLKTYQEILIQMDQLKAELHIFKSQLGLMDNQLAAFPSMDEWKSGWPERCPGCGAILPVHAYACPNDNTYPKSEPDKKEEPL